MALWTKPLIKYHERCSSLPYSEEYLPLNRIFMQDNDSKHKTKSVMKFFENEKSEFINMATPILGFKSIGKCLGGDGQSFE